MDNEKNKINDTATSNNKTMEYNNTVTNTMINQTTTDIIDNDANIEREAHFLIKRAESKYKPVSCLYSLCNSKSKRYNESCELFKKAGDKFKKCNQWRKAAICYDNCSIIKLKLKESPLKYYQESYLCFSKIDIGNESKMAFQKMNQYLEKEKQYFQVAKNNETLAQQKEKKKKFDEAINYYMEALKYYNKDGKHENLKTNIQIKLAELMLINNHPDANKKVPSILEDVGIYFMKKPTTNNSANDYFGKAVLSFIYYNNDSSEGDIYIKKYKKISKSFEESSIYSLCCDVSNSMENRDYSKLTSSIQKYKDINELDEFMYDILDKLIEKGKKFSIISSKKNNNDTDENSNVDL